jgi:hypothetical protein
MNIPLSGKGRVNDARSRYYWAWGATWITGITAWVTNGLFTSQNAIMSQTESMDVYQDTERLYYVSMGALITVGAVVAYKFFELGRYLNTATKNAPPIVKQEKPKQ